MTEKEVPVTEQDPEKGGFQGNEVIRKDKTQSSSEWVSRQIDDGLAKDQKVTARGYLCTCSRGPHCAAEAEGQGAPGPKSPGRKRGCRDLGAGLQTCRVLTRAPLKQGLKSGQRPSVETQSDEDACPPRYLRFTGWESRSL